MTRDKALEAKVLMNIIEHSENSIKELSRSCKDEYSIYYNGSHLYDLTKEEVDCLIAFHDTRRNEATIKLSKL